MDDEDFMDEAIRQSSVYSLDEFEDAFNAEDISVHTHSIRIIRE